MRLGPNIHLTYCSNIHPGESWKEVHQNLATYLPEVRRQLHHDGSFGIGLRLSAQAAETLETPETLAAFRDFLEEHDGYVFTINGFPYGVFHGTRVKEEVYLPDWRDEARLVYTRRLARILAARGLAQTRRAAMGMQLRLTPAGIALASEREREAVGALASIGNLHWLQPS